MWSRESGQKTLFFVICSPNVPQMFPKNQPDVFEKGSG